MNTKAIDAAAEALRGAFDRGEGGFDEQARLAIEAAEPHIRAAVLRCAALAFGESEPEGSYSSTPTQVIAWLNEYAGH